MRALPERGKARTGLLSAVVAAAVAVGALAAARQPLVAPQPPSLPTRLSDQEFWKLSSELSEAGGYFRSENLVSNEHTFQYVIPALRAAVRPGGVYLGVAPDQNFTYIVATRPRMAFIVDIRRGNLLQHLMYKALIELSADRADFVSRLFSKRRPGGYRPRARRSSSSSRRMQPDLDERGAVPRERAQPPAAPAAAARLPAVG